MVDEAVKQKEAFLAKAEAYLKEGLYQTAQDLAVDWLLRFPRDGEARMIACHAWMRLGKLDKVKVALKEVDEDLLKISLIYARLGDICAQSGLQKEAVSLYQRFLSINPEGSLSDEIRAKLKALLLPEDESDEEDLGGAPPSPSKFQTVTMAELYIKQGYREQAINLLKDILERDGENERAKRLLAELTSPGEGMDEKKRKVMATLYRWLENIQQMKRA